MSEPKMNIALMAETLETHPTPLRAITSSTFKLDSTNIIEDSPQEQLTPGRENLRKWLGKTFRVVITDGRVLVGYFNCTDKDANVVLSMCAEYLEEGKDARILGNVMIPGKHIVSISVDMPKEERCSSQSSYD